MKPDFSLVALLPSALSAISTGMLAVRISKGSWTRHPHYLAAAIIASTATIVYLFPSRPADAASVASMLLCGIVGGCAGVFVFSLVLGSTRTED
ncbi:MAG: hypothetical protein IKE42_12135 [Aquamicrobium sp.]|uniref:hypothetical protein n=1 Tax=Mesorhizobium sp. Pch-S TaxID=2082387 RepID=UPI0010C3C7B8|nr:hypothetical protein [Mesorhizobium sp. Pch-S]MBR2688596.1 hypothetical protein [Aquamicrobium sp.]QAZ45589.1 hypothetical protein C1M53_24350 [Mesorhizobium sp. Pch-S]